MKSASQRKEERQFSDSDKSGSVSSSSDSEEDKDLCDLVTQSPVLRPRSIRNKNKQRWNTGSNPLAQSENLDAPTGFEDEWEEAKSIGEESTNELMDMITPIATDFGNHSSCDFSKVKF